MDLGRALLPVILALGLLILSEAKAADRIERSTDQQGTIRIDNTAKEKASADRGKAPEVKDPAGAALPEAPPPGLLPSHSRRTRTGPGGEVIPRPKSPLLSPSPSAPPVPRPGAPGPGGPSAKPERQSAHESQ